MVLKHAIEQGAKSILLGIGGSATTDCGLGIAQALGYTFLDNKQNPLDPIGENLLAINTIKPPQKLLHNHVSITIASDVNNPLFGPNGAAFVYAPQKGADSTAVELLDAGLQHLANVAESQGYAPYSTGFGAGAAGGVGYGAKIFLNASIKPGAQIALEASGFLPLLAQTQLLISAEGKLDQQSISGKLIEILAKQAALQHIPFWVICGQNQLSPQELRQAGIQKVFEINAHSTNLTQAIQQPQLGLKVIFEEISFLVNNVTN
jgi:glycerate 2-kinase